MGWGGQDSSRPLPPWGTEALPPLLCVLVNDHDPHSSRLAHASKLCPTLPFLGVCLCSQSLSPFLLPFAAGSR